MSQNVVNVKYPNGMEITVTTNARNVRIRRTKSKPKPAGILIREVPVFVPVIVVVRDIEEEAYEILRKTGANGTY